MQNAIKYNWKTVCSVQVSGSRTSSVKRLLRLYFVGAPQEGWQFSLTFRHWLPSVTYRHTSPFSHRLKDPDAWVSLNISVQLATVFKLSETKVLYLVKLSRWQPHQVVELRVPWRWGERERDSCRDIGLLTVRPPDTAANLREFYWIQSPWQR